MEGVTLKDKRLLHFLSPTIVDELQIPVFGGAVDLVTYDAVTAVLQMNTDLVHATGDGVCFDEGEFVSVDLESLEGFETGD